MKIFDWFKKRKHRVYVEDVEFCEDEVLLEKTLDRDDVDMDDVSQREQYVRTCLEQMIDATQELELLEGEYRNVDSHLKDVEEVEMLTGHDKDLLTEHAKGVSQLSQDSYKYRQKERRLKDTDFKKMRRMENEAEVAIKKLTEAENYQDVIRQDLKRLEGEKHACAYRQSEANVALNNFRGMVIILICAIFASILLLVFLQFGLDMETEVGYVLVMFAAAISLFVLYFKYNDTQKELKRATYSHNRIVMLQNTVKIRYVNNTKLLDYLYVEYDVGSAETLKTMWERYLEEKDERIRMEQVLSDLDYHKEEIVKLLKRYRLYDPEIWTCQTEAIIDPREMVEVRHNLITQRQNLRKQMDYNRELAENAQDEIKELANLYPDYAKEIAKLVEMYGKNLRKES